MKRLLPAELRALLETGGFAVVLVAAEADPATMRQAEEFALLWVETLETGRRDVAFRYANTDAARSLGLISDGAAPPTIAIVRDGLIIEMQGGPRSLAEIRRLLFTPSPAAVIEASAGWKEPLAWAA
jgi:hypothetical protein